MPPDRHAEVLADIARFAGSSLDLDEVLERIVERAAALTGADRSSIWLLDARQHLLRPSALFGMDEQFTADWKRRPLALAAEPLSAEVIATGSPAVVEDARADPRTDKAMVEFFGDQSILVVPLARRGRVVGTLFMNHVTSRYRFTPGDVETATVIASQAAIAIDNAQLYGQARRLAQQLHRSFRHAGEALASGLDVERNLSMMLQLAVETLSAGGGALELLDEDQRTRYAVASSGTPAQDGEHHASYPLEGPSGTLGQFEIWRAAPPFSEDEHALLAAFAGHASAAVENARLYARLQDERERARAAERSQAEFSSMISHELRTPLALIKGYVTTLLRPPVPVPPDRARRFLEGIDSASVRLQRLIDNLLSASRLESEMFAITPVPLEVGALVRRAVAAAGVLGQGRTIDVVLPTGELWVLGDADQLTQVLENLVGNAIKYSTGVSPVAPVTVRAEREGDAVLLSVADLGPGIPPDALERVFEKFFRVRSRDGEETRGAGFARAPENSSNGHGLGLGLYICKRIVEAHGGRIWAENGLSGGATFYVRLTARHLT